MDKNFYVKPKKIIDGMICARYIPANETTNAVRGLNIMLDFFAFALHSFFAFIGVVMIIGMFAMAGESLISAFFSGIVRCIVTAKQKN